MRYVLNSSILLGAALFAGATFAQKLPLHTLPDDAKRDHWLAEQVNKPGALEALRATTGAKAVKFSGKQDKPIEIALIYPSADVSDYIARNYLALTARLDQLGIKYKATEFGTRMVEHSLQAQYVKQIVQDADLYDFVIYSPTELLTQADNIELLVNTPGIKTLMWSYETPLKLLTKQPVGWFNFSSADGAREMCKYALETVGKGQTFAMIRGVPGTTDNQRSDTFSNCVKEKGNWNLAYEHYGNFERDGGYVGTEQILQAYPEVTFIHNANTAMGLGSVEAQIVAKKTDAIFSTAWGGTGLELEALRRGELDATPMRLGDDVGAATAEAIKAVMEGRQEELPLVFLGRITIAHKELSVDQIDALEKEAFRFSGVGALSR